MEQWIEAADKEKTFVRVKEYQNPYCFLRLTNILVCLMLLLHFLGRDNQLCRIQVRLCWNQHD